MDARGDCRDCLWHPDVPAWGFCVVADSQSKAWFRWRCVSFFLSLDGPQRTKASADQRPDIESQVRLLTVPYARFVRTDPDLWVPPYEPPQDFVCIADPPSSYANNDDPVLDKQEPKKPAPKPKPVLNPPQPRDEYGVEVDLTDMLPNVASYHGWAVGVQEPEKPAPKPKPGPKPKPPQPRDGYAAGFPPANFISGTDGKAFSTLADQVLISQ